MESRGWTKLVVSCVYPVEKNLIVRTRSEKVDRIRKMILELLLAHAPDAFDLQDLAKEYGADKNRFEKEPSFCIHCGLCVRYCDEVKKKNAIGFVDRGIRKEISFIPEIAAKECWNCKECFPSLSHRGAAGSLRAYPGAGISCRRLKARATTPFSCKSPLTRAKKYL